MKTYKNVEVVWRDGRVTRESVNAEWQRSDNVAGWFFGTKTPTGLTVRLDCQPATGREPRRMGIYSFEDGYDFAVRDDFRFSTNTNAPQRTLAA